MPKASKKSEAKKEKSPILDRDAPVLREVAREVPVKDIGGAKLKKILAKMKKALHAEEDGVAIAAPQIGESLRAFVVNGEALAIVSGKGPTLNTDSKGRTLRSEDLVFINPEIANISKKRRRMEEGCLSVRWLYGDVLRSEKITIRAYNEKGEKVERGASGLLAQIFQHEIDHLNGILFIDKAKNIRDLPPENPAGAGFSGQTRFVFFGSSQFSKYVLEELEAAGLSPLFTIDSAKDPLPMEKLREADADVFVVASFGKILPREVIDMPRRGTLNVHPSLLPRLRGAAPIQNLILNPEEKPGVTIIRMDEKMDHGPIVAQEELSLEPWPDYYSVAEEKLGREGGRLLAEIMPDWAAGELEETPQDDSRATYVKLVKKEDALIEEHESDDMKRRKVLAYDVWPKAYFFFTKKTGKKIRVVVKEAELIDEKFTPTKVIPEGKKEMDWEDFLKGNG